MKQKSVFDVLNSGDITTEKAIELIESLSPEQILEQDGNGATILHAFIIITEFRSVKFDITEVIKAIVNKNKAVLDLKWNDSLSPFEFAIYQDNLDCVRILTPYYRENKDQLVMHKKKITIEGLPAAADDDLDAEKDYVEKSFTIIETNPTTYALRHRQFKMFEYLFKNGFGSLKGIEDRSEYDLDTTEGLQALYRDLFVSGNKELLKELHTHLGYYTGHNGQNSMDLIAALESGNKDLALYLISQGHYIYDFTGFTPPRDHPEIFNFILAHAHIHPNFNPHAEIWNRFTLLKYAASRGFKNLIDVELDAAKGNAVLLNNLFTADDTGNNLLHYAVSSGHKEIVASIIKAANGDVTLFQTLFTHNQAYNTPLHLASNNKEITEIITKASNSNKELKKIIFAPHGEDNTSALSFSLEYGSTEVAFVIIKAAEDDKELLKILFTPNSNHRQNPLHITVEKYEFKEVAAAIITATKGDSELLKTLDTPDIHGHTPLYLAARLRRAELVNLMLANGFCPSLSMLLNNTFTPEINSILRKGYITNHVDNVMSMVWHALEGASNAFAGDMTEFYDGQAKNSQQNRNNDRNNQR